MARLTLNWSDVLLYTGPNVNIHAPLSAGVYRLSYQNGDRRPVFYVGQADNLYQRLREHLSDAEPNGCIVRCLRHYTCYFRFAKVARQADRDCAERALYDHYNPECNDTAPPGEPCDINFE